MSVVLQAPTNFDCPTCDGHNGGEGSIPGVRLPDGSHSFAAPFIDGPGILRLAIPRPTERWSIGASVAALCSITARTNGVEYIPVEAEICWPGGRKALFTTPAIQNVSAVWRSSPDVASTIQYNAVPNANGATFVLSSIDGSTTEYDSAGSVVLYTNRDGRRLHYTYAGILGSLSRISDDFGNGIDLTVSLLTGVAAFTAPDGQVYTYTPDRYGTFAKLGYPDGSYIQYLFEESSYSQNPTALIDENGDRYVVWRYDAEGRVDRVQYGVANGVALQEYNITYGTNGIVTIVDPLGTQRTFSYQDDGYAGPVLVGTTLPCDECGPNIHTKTVAANGAKGLMSQSTDFRGNVTRYTWDYDRLLQTGRTEAYGTSKQRTTMTTWETNFRLPHRIEEPGRTTVLSHDASGNLLSRTVTDTSTGTSQTWTYSGYTGWGQPQTIDGPRTDVADITQRSFYPIVPGDSKSGQLHTVTDALGHVTTYDDYDSGARPTAITDANGVVTTLAYWPRGWLKSVQVGTEATNLEYWPTGLLKKVIYPDGRFQQYSYDIAHRLTDVYDQLGNHIHYTLNGGREPLQIDIYDASGAHVQTAQRVYDVLGRLWKDVGAYPGETTVYDYDGNSNRTLETDALSRQTQLGYDPLDRLSSITDAANGLSEYAYDGLDQLTDVTDPRSLVTPYTVDAHGNRKAVYSPDGGDQQFAYDSAGNIVSSTDAKNQTTQYTYDALNRLTKLTRAGGTSVVYAWDQNDSTHGAGIGRLTRVTDSLSNVTVDFKYDARGRLTGKTTVVGSRTMNLGWSYESTTGRLIEMVLPSGKSVRYTWASGQITGLSLKNGLITSIILSNISYQPFGGPKRWTHANGQVAQRTYDLNGRVTSDPVDQMISYDPTGRITSYQLGNFSVISDTHNVGYDSLGRLTSFTDALANFVYDYDKTGNRKLQTVGSLTTNFAIDLFSNRITQATAGSSVLNYTYDANGSRAGSAPGSRTYTYDVSGRLAGFQSPDHTASYVYDGLGQRVQKTVDGQVSSFAYDTDGKLIADYRGNVLVGETVYLGAMPVAIVVGNNVYAVHADWRDAPRQVNDANGVATWAWDPAPFGGGSPDERPNGQLIKFTLNLRYPGQYYDDETGLFYNNARYYDPAIGRYLESDPIGLAGGLNTYAYVGGDPVGYIDPYGFDGATAALWANIMVGNTDYQWWDPNPNVRVVRRPLLGGRFSNKCNFFVYDALEGGGDPPGLMPDGRRPSASEWANPAVNIPGYTVLPIPLLPHPGDVVAMGGHVGIYSPLIDGRPGTISASAKDQIVIHNDWGFRPGDHPTIRRCECDAN